MIFGLQPAEQASSATNCGPIPFRKSPQPSGRTYPSGPAGREDAVLRPGAAAGCCGSFRNRKFSIQNSRFKIANRDATCGGHARSRLIGCELRAFAGRSCGPLRFLPEPQIQHSKFKIQNCQSGRSLRRSRIRADLRTRAAGLPHGLFKVEIQHSGFNMKCTPIPAASNPTAARAFRRSAPAPVFTSRNTSPTAPWRR